MVRVIVRPAVMSRDVTRPPHTEERRVDGRDARILTDHQLNIISIDLIRYNQIKYTLAR